MNDARIALGVTVAATFFGAGAVKGVTGMGLPTIAMGVLGSLFSPATAAALLIAPSFVTNVWQLLAGPSVARLAMRLWAMMTGIVVGTIAGTALLSRGDTAQTTRALGATLAVYAVASLAAGLRVRPRRLPSALEPWLSPLVGLATGVVTGGTGVFVIPAVPYLEALGLPKDDLVQALGLSFTASTCALAAGLAWHGAYHTTHLAISALAVAPALAGMWAGAAVRARISPVAFRRAFLVLLLLLGAEMLARPPR